MLQQYKRGELAAAAERAHYIKGVCMLYEYRHLLREQGPPSILFVGESHVSRLKIYSKKQSTPSHVRRALGNSHFVAVGGTGWDNCLDSFKGIGLNQRNAHFGN